MIDYALRCQLVEARALLAQLSDRDLCTLAEFTPPIAPASRMLAALIEGERRRRLWRDIAILRMTAQEMAA